MKQGETLALNERIMLSLVSTGHDCPFIVCMTYAFHTQDKLCFILDLMNGGDLHYHLSQVLVSWSQHWRFVCSELRGFYQVEKFSWRWRPNIRKYIQFYLMLGYQY